MFGIYIKIYMPIRKQNLKILQFQLRIFFVEFNLELVFRREKNKSDIGFEN